MVDLSKIFLFRMTHIDNVPHIISNGLTHITSANYNPLYKSIGDSSVISKRHYIKVPSQKQLSEFIPFYFNGRMPMLYVIQNGFNGVSQVSPNDVVFFVTNIKIIIEHNLTFFYTDKHAVNKFAKFFTIKNLENIHNDLDFEAINSLNWKRDDDNDFKARKEAEFLISPDVPFSTLGTFIVHNENSINKMLEFGVDKNKVKINKKYYF